jgi:hypothetical protein
MMRFGRRVCVRSLLAVSFVALAVVGCSSQGNPYGVTPVSGKVTYEDGSLIQAPIIYLKFFPDVPPKDSKTNPRPGSAWVNVSDGTFSAATTYKPDDGLIPGKHTVVVRATDREENPSPALSLVYSDVSTTPLKVDVTPGGKPLELKLSKPK